MSASTQKDLFARAEKLIQTASTNSRRTQKQFIANDSLTRIQNQRNELNNSRLLSLNDVSEMPPENKSFFLNINQASKELQPVPIVSEEIFDEYFDEKHLESEFLKEKSNANSDKPSQFSPNNEIKRIKLEVNSVPTTLRGQPINPITPSYNF